MSVHDQAAEVYWAFARAKAKWRSFMGKPPARYGDLLEGPSEAEKVKNPSMVSPKARSQTRQPAYQNTMNPN